MRTGDTVYDALALILPEALKALEESGHPKLSAFDEVKGALPFLVAASSEKLRVTPPTQEDQLVADVFRYAVTATVRMHSDGDLRPYILLNELFLEIPPVKRLARRAVGLLDSVPMSPSIGECNGATPVLLGMLSERRGGRRYILTERWIAESAVLREALDEYFRRYGMEPEVVMLDDGGALDGLAGSLDALLAATLSAWRLGWERLLGLASSLLKKKGYFAAILPVNSREGMRTLLSILDVPVYPQPGNATTSLRAAKLQQVWIGEDNGFFSVVATKK